MNEARTPSLKLHPVVQKMLEAARAAQRPALSAGTPQQARAQVAAGRGALGPGPQEVTMQPLALPTRTGTIAARLYRPAAEPLGLIVYLHGGGWVFGASDDFDGLARLLAQRSGCALLLVDYRLAPEHPFPCALHDAEDAITWAHGPGMAALGNRVPVVVCGDSAGANLGIAAVLSTQQRAPVAFQAWFYPVVDSDFERASYRDCSEGMPLTLQDMRWCFGHYAPPDRWADPQISVLRSGRLRESPRTWVGVAEFDVLRDEGEDYAQQLRAAGVSVDLHVARGLPHGFARMFNHVDSALQVVEEAAVAIAGACRAAGGNVTNS